MIDRTDLEIIDILAENSRVQLKEIGGKVHMTGQAVSARIQKLQDLGIIEKFTVKLDTEKMGKPLNAYVLVSMKSNNHAEFIAYLKKRDIVIEAFRIAGNGCFLLKVNTSSQTDLEALLDEILFYGNYSVSTCISRIK